MHVRKLVSDQQGVFIIMVAIGLLVFLGFMAVAVDVGFVLVVRNELYNLADAGALAGTSVIGCKRAYVDYPTCSSPRSPEAQQSYELTEDDYKDVRTAVVQAATKNNAGGQSGSITIDESKDIGIGQWHGKTRTFTPTPAPGKPDAVEVTARRQDKPGYIPLTPLVAQILGINTAAATSTSRRESDSMWKGHDLGGAEGEEGQPLAALTGQKKVKPGDLEIPVGIGMTWFDEGFCNKIIKFFPTTDSCAGWTTFELSPANATTLRDDVIGGMLAVPPTYEAPGFQTGNTMNFVGGNVANALCPPEASGKPGLDDLYLARRDVDGVWRTQVAVYETTACSTNPSGSIEVVGFASVEVFNVQCAPEQIIEAKVMCELVKPSRGGGGEYGTKGTIPGLVR